MSESSTDGQTAPTQSTHTTSDHLGFNHPRHWQKTGSRKAPGFKQPTHVNFHDPTTGANLEWNSRNHRKGKHPRNRTGMVPPAEEEKVKKALPEWTSRYAFPRIWGWDFNDISWWVAQFFLIGSVFWCANGILDWDYFTDSSNHIGVCEAVTAFLGGTLFLFGGYLSYVESLNPTRDTDFGWELDEEAHKLFQRKDGEGPLGRKRDHFGKHVHSKGEDPAAGGPEGNQSEPPPWRWYGTDWKSLGFTANFIQLCGASIFWISTLCGLPGILPVSGNTATSGLPTKSLGLWEGLFWAPQILGAPCFVVSAAMFMFEVQRKWYIPRPLDVGWHVGFWNMIGGFGFWFSGIFGVFREVRQDQYQQWGTSFSTWWGSWAFLIGSYFQLYETLNKRP